MSLKDQSQRRFIFENSNGVRYDVRLNHAGTGEAYKLTGSSSKGDRTKVGITKVALTIDAGSVVASRAWHPSRLAVAAVYNTGQTLNTVLNAAS